MDYILTNAGSILIATGAGLVFSVLYARWMQTAARSGSVPIVLFVAAAIAEFWLASILAGALILAPLQEGAWTIAFGSAAVIWIGFVLPTLVVSEIFRGVPLSKALADCAHWLAVMLIQAVALQTAGLVKPHP